MSGSKYGVDDKVHAKILGTREAKNEAGEVVFTRNGKGEMTPTLETFTMREFDGEVINVHQRKEGESAYTAYKVTCPDLDRGGSMWVEERFLTPQAA